MKHNPFEIAFGIVLTVCLCVAPDQHIHHRLRSPKMSDNVNHQTRKETLEMRRKRKPLAPAGIGLTAITMSLLTPVFLLALAGCGSASEPSTPAHEVRSIDSQCSDMDDDFSECVITLTDTRKVDCVVYSDYKQGGLSCDWSHVSGADKEPAR